MRTNRETDDPEMMISHNLLPRVISGLILCAAAGGAYYEGNRVWLCFVVFLGAIAGLELWGLARRVGPGTIPFIVVFGAINVFSAVFLIVMRQTLGGSKELVMCVFSVIVADVISYFVAGSFGRVAVAEEISESMTWSGLVLGSVAGILVFVSIGLRGGIPVIHTLPIAFVCLAFAQFGVLFEAFLKREAGVTVSGLAVPGLGGTLGRVNSTAFAIVGFVVSLTWAAG